MTDPQNKLNIQIISASAGSGKTYRLSKEMIDKIRAGEVRAEAIIATTFTEMAAKELKERVFKALLKEGLYQEANAINNHALIGTVHSIGSKLLQRFAFELGVPPKLSVMSDDDSKSGFNNALANILLPDAIEKMDKFSHLMSFSKDEDNDWRRYIHSITDIARSNLFSKDTLELSKKKSIENCLLYLGDKTIADSDIWLNKFLQLLETTILELKNSNDTTVKTQTCLRTLTDIQHDHSTRGRIPWASYIKIEKLAPAVKSKDIISPLQDFSKTHVSVASFHNEIADTISEIFDWAIKAMDEYEAYKQKRGLIDYADMEAKVSQLLRLPQVINELSSEIDLLMVDEFQDTNPIQLDIFIQLSRLAKYSIWVGDPKQSIYGFRGAEPSLMKSIIDAAGGVAPDNILSNSFRSRKELVYFANAIFQHAFPSLSYEQIVLTPQREEPLGLDKAIQIWHFDTGEEGKQKSKKPWMQKCVGTSLQELLKKNVQVVSKDGKSTRDVMPADIAILCRRNIDCIEMADQLQKLGIKAAIPRVGLMDTAEAYLVKACLKFLINPNDSLSVAEIRYLIAGESTESLIQDRLDWLQTKDAKQLKTYNNWAFDQPIIARMNQLRPKTSELSIGELLDVLLNEFDLQRVVSSWGDANRRMANLDMLRRYCKQYEDKCQRQNQASSIGGFILWLAELNDKSKDEQSAAQDPSAVNIMTYHRSKGLEWPIVICMNLEADLKDDILDKFELVNESNVIDFENILGGRYIRFWFNPYGLQKGNTSYINAIRESADFKTYVKNILEEEARLLYVALTRARDYIILPTNKFDNTLWLNRVCNDGDETISALDFDSNHLLYTWEDKPVFVNYINFIISPTMNTTLSNNSDRIFWWKSSENKIQHEVENIAASEVAKSFAPLVLKNSINFGQNLKNVYPDIEAQFDALKKYLVSHFYRNSTTLNINFNISEEALLQNITQAIASSTSYIHKFIKALGDDISPNVPFLLNTDAMQTTQAMVDLVINNISNKTIYLLVFTASSASEQNALNQLSIARKAISKHPSTTNIIAYTIDPIHGNIKQWT
ncbi:MAG: UvrD-helicase domain-containing protein [Saprospiraceae bacterium]|nr:UvrD-helicase domain-containing protein [Saprospiraceae bacterium]